MSLKNQTDLFSYGFRNPLHKNAHKGVCPKREGERKMELTMEKGFEIEDGKHTGLITKVEYVDTPFKYTEVYVRPEGTDFEIRYGCPTTLTPNSKLARLLNKFKKVDLGDSADPEKILVGRHVSFMTQKKHTPKGEFVNIVEDSITALRDKKD